MSNDPGVDSLATVRPAARHQVLAASEIPLGEPGRDVDIERWRRLAEAALDREHPGAGELNLLFVGEAEMAELNGEHMDEPGPTDVLAFPIDGDAEPQGEVPVLLGDVVVCPEVAYRNAAERGFPAEDELALLVVHGVLHVLGHDHHEVEEAELMRSRERALLEALHQR